MSFHRGEVVLVDFPFADGTGSKIRPAIIVQSDHNNARIANTIVAMITRRAHKAASEPTQILIDPQTADGQSTGLFMVSAVTCENLFTVNQRGVIRKLGSMTPSMMQVVDACLKAALALP